MRRDLIPIAAKPKYVPEPVRQNKDNLFVLRHKGDLYTLNHWLMARKYNAIVESIDKNGQRMIGLIWDYQLGVYPSRKRMDRGVIVVKQDYLFRDSMLAALDKMSTETEYGIHWKRAQVELWKYGKK